MNPLSGDIDCAKILGNGQPRFMGRKPGVVFIMPLYRRSFRIAVGSGATSLRIDDMFAAGMGTPLMPNSSP